MKNLSWFVFWSLPFVPLEFIPPSPGSPLRPPRPGKPGRPLEPINGIIDTSINFLNITRKFHLYTE